MKLVSSELMSMGPSFEEKKSFNYCLSLKCGTCLNFFSEKLFVQSGLKLHDLTVVAAGIEMKKFVI